MQSNTCISIAYLSSGIVRNFIDLFYDLRRKVDEVEVMILIKTQLPCHRCLLTSTLRRSLIYRSQSGILYEEHSHSLHNSRELRQRVATDPTPIRRTNIYGSHLNFNESLTLMLDVLISNQSDFSCNNRCLANWSALPLIKFFSMTKEFLKLAKDSGAIDN